VRVQSKISNADFAHVPNALCVLVNQAIARRASEFDVLVDWNALDHGK
jgi:hypothetical protein